MEKNAVLNTLPWYEKAVFYHIYPLGMCAAAKTQAEYNGAPSDKIRGLKAYLPHLQELGVTALYIGPLFSSEGHGYETRDYYRVDDRLGTNEDFKDFVDACHEAGIRVVVDGVFNHTGREFFAFRDVREHREGSRYRDWYCWVNFGNNNEFNDGFSYEAWHGYSILPRLNLKNPEVKQYLFDVIRFWHREFGIDGIRLDCADVLDFDFMREMRDVVRSLAPDFWLMGEVIHGDYSRWVNDSMLHSVTNYELHKGLYSGHNDHNYFEIAHTVRRLFDGNGGIVKNHRLYTFVENHDVNRLVNKLNDEEQMSNVYLLAYTLPGIPSIYYGGEFRLNGVKENGSDDPLRPAIPIEEYGRRKEEEKEFVRFLSMLGRAKRDLPALSAGRYEERFLTNRQYAFARICDGQTVLVCVNNDESDVTISVRAQDGCYREFEKEIVCVAADGTLSVNLAARSGVILIRAEE